MNSSEKSISRKTLTSEVPDYLRELAEAGGEIFEVGGPVRDRLLGKPGKDHDLLVRRLTIEKIEAILKRHGDLFFVGKSFGVLKFRPKDEKTEFDIVLPRKEVSTGVGHRDFKVDFDPDIPIEEDLRRRDFTINAMALNLLTGTLVDPFNGKKDLEGRILRQVGEKAFEEDPLRLLRAVQFSARLNLTIEEKTFDAMRRNAHLIKTVSPERIAEEIGKLLTAERPSVGFCIMKDAGILRYVIPELQETVGVEQGQKLKADDVFTHTMRVLDAARKDAEIANAGDLELVLAALFHDTGKPRTKGFDEKKNRITFYSHQLVSRKLALRRIRELKMTILGINIDNIAKLIENHMFQAKSFFSDKAIRRFIQKVGEDLILKLIDLRLADNRGGKYPEGIRGVQKLKKRIEDEFNKKSPFTTKDLAISGHDIMALGIPEGPEVGHILKNLLEIVLDDPMKNEKETLLHIMREDLGYGTNAV